MVWCIWKQGCVEDISRGVQIALSVAAYELLVCCESYVALDDTSALTTGSTICCIGVLGILKRCATVREDEV